MIVEDFFEAIIKIRKKASKILVKYLSGGKSWHYTRKRSRFNRLLSGGTKRATRKRRRAKRNK